MHYLSQNKCSYVFIYMYINIKWVGYIYIECLNTSQKIQAPLFHVRFLHKLSSQKVYRTESTIEINEVIDFICRMQSEFIWLRTTKKARRSRKKKEDWVKWKWQNAFQHQIPKKKHTHTHISKQYHHHLR